MLDCILVGDIMMDVVLRTPHRILSGLNIEGTNYFTESIVEPGGSGNVAAAINHLGGQTALIGRAGDDPYGRVYIQDLESRGVQSRINLDTSRSTGVTVSLVEPGGHRTLLVARGANDELTTDEVRGHFDKLESSKFVYLTGYSLANLPQQAAVLRAAKIASHRKAIVVFDPASSNLARSLPKIFASAVDSCDLLCANLDETSVLADTLTPLDYARSISKKGKTVIVKMGAKGCLLAKDGKSIEIPGFSVRSIDTTGAGDAFLGSMLCCLSQGMDHEKAASFGNWFASHITVGLGPRHFPAKDNATAMLSKIKK